MTSKKKSTYTPNINIVPAPTTDKEYLNKQYPPLDISSTVSNPSAQDPMIILVALPINTPTPDNTNTSCWENTGGIQNGAPPSSAPQNQTSTSTWNPTSSTWRCV